jgi:hypothetical protein
MNTVYGVITGDGESAVWSAEGVSVKNGTCIYNTVQSMGIHLNGIKELV